jgi:hypothetical protein
VTIDWELVVKIAVPLGALVLGKCLDRILSNKPKLISYIGHVSTFTLQGEQAARVFAHSVVLRNTGRVAAENVRVGHYVLPNYQLQPPIAFDIIKAPTGESEIHIAKLVPGEQVTISYLYFPPLTWDRVNAYTNSDAGPAKVLSVIPTPQPPRSLRLIMWALVLVGALTIFYTLATILLYVIR